MRERNPESSASEEEEDWYPLGAQLVEVLHRLMFLPGFTVRGVRALLWRKVMSAPEGR